jgi:hypothetical protein
MAVSAALKRASFAPALMLGVLICYGTSGAQELAQKPVVAAATIVMRLLQWRNVDIELTEDRAALVLAKDPELRAKGGIPVRQVTDCKFEFAGPEGIRIDFAYLSNEYSYRARSTGITLTFRGTGDGSPMCYEKSCYRDLEISGTRGDLERVLRAVEFISENSCPLRKLPF